MRRWVIAGCVLAVVAVGVTAAGASGLEIGKSPGKAPALSKAAAAATATTTATPATGAPTTGAMATVSPPPVVAPPRLVATTASTVTFPGSPPRLDWPDSGQAAVEVVGMGDLGTSGTQSETPTASVAKAMTAYVVLTDHPLTGDESGPTLVVSRSEADAYDSEAAQNESLVRVSAGERLTERQAL
jgi:D-alanyl-D-alanine carboxypeptidase (penicillin-binding protein 5/6)